MIVKPNAGGSFGEDTASTHVLSGEFVPLRVDGSRGAPVRKVTLCNGEAAILERAAP